MAEKVAAETRALDTLRQQPSPDPARLDDLENARTWDTRVFSDRQHSLRLVCDQPVLVEQRAFALARIIQEHVKKPLAEEVLFGKLAKGGTVRILLDGDALHFDYLSREEETALPGRPERKALPRASSEVEEEGDDKTARKVTKRKPKAKSE